MKASARIVLVIAAATLLTVPVLMSSSPKTKTITDKTVQGTVVAATDSNLVIRKGNLDWSLAYDAASLKPSTLPTGASVLIHYRDEKNIHIITKVELTDGKSGNSPSQAK